MRKSEMLKQGNYMTVIKPLAHKIGLDETIILMELVGMEEHKEQKHLLFKEIMELENKMMNPNKVCFYEEDRAFECTSTELELATTIKEGKQRRIIDKLVDMNLIETTPRGLPSRRFIILNHKNIEQLLEDAINEYPDFKEAFFKEKREFIKRKMMQRKKRHTDNTINSQFHQNDGTENINVSEKSGEKKAAKPHGYQFRQNNGTSTDTLTEQDPSKQPPLNNNLSINISINKNNKSIYLEEIKNLEIEKSIKFVLIKRIDRLIEDQIKLDDIVALWQLEKSDKNGLTELQFADMLTTALIEAKEPIGSKGSASNFFKTAIKRYKQNLISPSTSKQSSKKKVVVPDWFKDREKKLRNKKTSQVDEPIYTDEEKDKIKKELEELIKSITSEQPGK